MLLSFDRARIEIGVLTTPSLGQESEEREDHGNVVLVRREKKCVESAQHCFINLARFRHVFLPAGPDSGAHHVYSRFFHRAEVVVPNEWIRLEEEATMFVGRHVSRAGYWKHASVTIEQMFVDCQWLTAREEFLVVDPEAGVVRE